MSQSKIHSAIVASDLTALKRLLASGESLDVHDERGATPLFAAAFHGRLEIVEFLIQQGVSVNEGNQVNYTPLMAAGREKRLDVVEALLKAKADPEIKAQGMKAVHWSLMDTVPKRDNRPYESETRLIEILRTFKRYGANLNTRGEKGNTILMDAAWWNLVYVTEFLLQEGANPRETDNDGETAEGYAKRKLAKNFDAETNDRCERIIQMLKNGPAKKPWWKIL